METQDRDLERRLETLETSARRARWWRRTALALVVVGLGVPFAADALGPVPNTFSGGDVISAKQMNDNFAHLQDAITALEEAPVNTVTVRKVTGSGAAAIAFCESDEILTGGGCFLPPENNYDADFADFETYHTGSFPRPMVGLTSVPVAADTELADLRPTAPTERITPFPGDIIAGDDGAAVAEPGGGWGCRAGIVNHNSADGAQFIVSPFTESWFFHVKAYAVCMKVN